MSVPSPPVDVVSGFLGAGKTTLLRRRLELGAGGERVAVVVNELGIPLARELTATPGELQRFTPAIEALYVPNIDDALDEESAKREFWGAFRVLGQWWADLPPY